MVSGVDIPWVGVSIYKYNDKKLTLGSKYHIENRTRGQFTMGFKIPYDTGFSSLYIVSGIREVNTLISLHCLCQNLNVIDIQSQ
jgi:hypothetical protein